MNTCKMDIYYKSAKNALVGEIRSLQRPTVKSQSTTNDEQTILLGAKAQPVQLIVQHNNNSFVLYQNLELYFVWYYVKCYVKELR